MSRFTKLFEIFDRAPTKHNHVGDFYEPQKPCPPSCPSSDEHCEVTRELCLEEIVEVAEQDARAEQLWGEFEAKHRPWSVRKV